MRALIRQWPMFSLLAGIFLAAFLLPALNLVPSGLWVALPFMVFLPAALRSVGQDVQHAFWRLRAKTARAKVSDEAIHAFLNERSDERQ